MLGVGPASFRELDRAAVGVLFNGPDLGSPVAHRARIRETTPTG